MSEIKAAKVVSAAVSEALSQKRNRCKEDGPQAIRNLMIRLGLYAEFCKALDSDGDASG